MAAITLSQAPWKSLDRVCLQTQYLRKFAFELLAGVPGAEWHALFGNNSLCLGDSGDVEKEIADAGNHASALPAPYGGKLAGALTAFHQRAVNLVSAAANPFLLSANAPAPKHSAAYLNWAWRRSEKASARRFGFGPAGPLGLALCHQLLLYQAAGWASRPAASGDWAWLAQRNGPQRLTEWRRKSGDRMKTLWRKLRQTPVETADMVTHMAAILGFWYALRDRLPAPPHASGGATWNDLLSQLDADCRDVLLRLSGQNDLVVAGLPELREAVQQGDYRPALGVLQIGHRVQTSLTDLQVFSAQLVQRQDALTIRQPLEIGRAGAGEVDRFAAIHSPLLTEKESAEFSQQLLEGLVSCEKKLFYATVTPRPAFCDSFLRWARERFLLSRGFHFPLSDLCLHTMLYCHNLLALQAALSAAKTAKKESDRARAEAASAQSREALQAPAAQFAKGTPLLGDYFMLHLALKGLQHQFGGRLCGTGQASWEDILPRLPDECADAVLTLAARSPMVRLVVADLDSALGNRNEPWQHLRHFLDDPAGEPLRDFVAGRLVESAWNQPEAMAGGMHRILNACLGDNSEGAAQPPSIGGTLLVGEFLQVLLQRLFREGDATAVTVNGQGRGTQHQERLRHAAQRFAAWFADIDRPVPKAVVDLLVGFLKSKTAIESQSSADGNPHVAMLRQHWRAIGVQTLRGLRQRPWQGRLQRLLRIHWLNFCLVVFERFPVRPSCLETGDRTWDDLAAMACRLTAQLYRAHRALERQLRTRDETPGEARAAPIDEDARADAATIDKLLRKVLRDPSFRTALLVRGLLMLDKQKQPQWNLARIAEY